MYSVDLNMLKLKEDRYTYVLLLIRENVKSLYVCDLIIALCFNPNKGYENKMTYFFRKVEVYRSFVRKMPPSKIKFQMGLTKSQHHFPNHKF